MTTKRPHQPHRMRTEAQAAQSYRLDPEDPNDYRNWSAEKRDAEVEAWAGRCTEVPGPQTVTYTPTTAFCPRFGPLVGREVWDGRELDTLPVGTLLVDMYGTSTRIAGTDGAKELHTTLKESQHTTVQTLAVYVSYSHPRVVVWAP